MAGPGILQSLQTDTAKEGHFRYKHLFNGLLSTAEILNAKKPPITILSSQTKFTRNCCVHVAINDKYFFQKKNESDYPRKYINNEGIQFQKTYLESFEQNIPVLLSSTQLLSRRLLQCFL